MYSFRFSEKHRNQQFDMMVNTNIHSLHTLPVEIIYRILDNLSLYRIVCSMLNVCTRLDAVVCSYHRNEVSFIYGLFIELNSPCRNKKPMLLICIYIFISI